MNDQSTPSPRIKPPVDPDVQRIADAEMTSSEKLLGGSALLLMADFIIALSLNKATEPGLWMFPLAAFAGGQFAIVGLNLAMGRWPLLGRLTLCILMVTTWALPVQSSEAAGAVTLLMLFYAAIAGLARSVGMRIVFLANENKLQATERGKIQFSLRQIFGLTTAVAVLLGVMQSGLVTFTPFHPSIGMFFFALAAPLAAWGVLAERGYAWPIVLIGAFILSIATVVPNSEGLQFVWYVLAAMLCFQIAVALILLPARLLGYRVRFVNKIKTAALPANGDAANIVDDIPD